MDENSTRLAVQRPTTTRKSPQRARTPLDAQNHQSSQELMYYSSDSEFEDELLECESMLITTNMALSTGLMALITGEMTLRSEEMALEVGKVALEAGRTALSLSGAKDTPYVTSSRDKRPVSRSCSRCSRRNGHIKADKHLHDTNNSSDTQTRRKAVCRKCSAKSPSQKPPLPVRPSTSALSSRPPRSPSKRTSNAMPASVLKRRASSDADESGCGVSSMGEEASDADSKAEMKQKRKRVTGQDISGMKMTGPLMTSDTGKKKKNKNYDAATTDDSDISVANLQTFRGLRSEEPLETKAVNDKSSVLLNQPESDRVHARESNDSREVKTEVLSPPKNIQEESSKSDSHAVIESRQSHDSRKYEEGTVASVFMSETDSGLDSQNESLSNKTITNYDADIETDKVGFRSKSQSTDKTSNEREGLREKKVAVPSSTSSILDTSDEFSLIDQLSRDQLRATIEGYEIEAALVSDLAVEHAIQAGFCQEPDFHGHDLLKAEVISNEDSETYHEELDDFSPQDITLSEQGDDKKSVNEIMEDDFNVHSSSDQTLFHVDSDFSASQSSMTGKSSCRAFNHDVNQDEDEHVVTDLLQENKQKSLQTEEECQRQELEKIQKLYSAQEETISWEETAETKSSTEPKRPSRSRKTSTAEQHFVTEEASSPTIKSIHDFKDMTGQFSQEKKSEQSNENVPFAGSQVIDSQTLEKAQESGKDEVPRKEVTTMPTTKSDTTGNSSQTGTSFKDDADGIIQQVIEEVKVVSAQSSPEKVQEAQPDKPPAKKPRSRSRQRTASEEKFVVEVDGPSFSHSFRPPADPPKLMESREETKALICKTSEETPPLTAVSGSDVVKEQESGKETGNGQTSSDSRMPKKSQSSADSEQSSSTAASSVIQQQQQQSKHESVEVELEVSNSADRTWHSPIVKTDVAGLDVVKEQESGKETGNGQTPSDSRMPKKSQSNADSKQSSSPAASSVIQQQSKRESVEVQLEVSNSADRTWHSPIVRTNIVGSDVVQEQESGKGSGQTPPEKNISRMLKKSDSSADSKQSSSPVISSVIQEQQSKQGSQVKSPQEESTESGSRKGSANYNQSRLYSSSLSPRRQDHNRLSPLPVSSLVSSDSKMRGSEKAKPIFVQSLIDLRKWSPSSRPTSLTRVLQTRSSASLSPRRRQDRKVTVLSSSLLGSRRYRLPFSATSLSSSCLLFKRTSDMESLGRSHREKRDDYSSTSCLYSKISKDRDVYHRSRRYDFDQHLKRMRRQEMQVIQDDSERRRLQTKKLLDEVSDKLHLKREERQQKLERQESHRNSRDWLDCRCRDSLVFKGEPCALHAFSDHYHKSHCSAFLLNSFDVMPDAEAPVVVDSTAVAENQGAFSSFNCSRETLAKRRSREREAGKTFSSIIKSKDMTFNRGSSEPPVIPSIDESVVVSKKDTEGMPFWARMHLSSHQVHPDRHTSLRTSRQRSPHLSYFYFDHGDYALKWRNAPETYSLSSSRRPSRFLSKPSSPVRCSSRDPSLEKTEKRQELLRSSSFSISSSKSCISSPFISYSSRNRDVEMNNSHANVTLLSNQTPKSNSRRFCSSSLDRGVVRRSSSLSSGKGFASKALEHDFDDIDYHVWCARVHMEESQERQTRVSWRYRSSSTSSSTSFRGYRPVSQAWQSICNRTFVSRR